MNWEDYLSEEVLTQWHEHSSIHVEQIFFDNDEKRDDLLIDSKNHKIDIAVVDEVIAERFGKNGLLVELNEENLPSLKHISDFWRQRCGQYAAPYFWGSFGIAYRSDKVAQAPSSWDDLLNPNEGLRNHIGMLDDHTDMLAPPLFHLGYSINTDDPEILKSSFQLLKQQVPYVLTYDYAISYLKSGKQPDELYMAPVYSGDQYVLNDIAGKKGLWKYVVPKEGSILWVDCLAIPTSSTNQQAAIQFIDFLNQPQIAAQNAKDLFFATPNEAALKVLPQGFATDPEVFPPKSIIERGQLYQELSGKNIELRNRITNAILNLHESEQAR